MSWPYSGKLNSLFIIFPSSKEDLFKLFILFTLRAFSAFNFGAQGLTRIAALTPEFKKASNKITSVFATLDRKTKLEVTEGEYPDQPLTGNIVFKDVYFKYPTRKQVKVLRVGNFMIKIILSKSPAKLQRI